MRTPESDQLRRFVFEDRPLRGAVVRLGPGWRDLLAHREYPPALEALLGEALAAGPLLASTLKFEGRLSLQGEGNGAIRLLLAQTTHDLEVRATLRHDPAGDFSRPFAELFGDARLGVLIEPLNGARYQGLVPLHGQHLAACLGAYFRQSEQLPSCFRFAVSHDVVVGVLLQTLPGADDGGEHFQQAAMALTMGDDVTLLDHDAPSLLSRLYPEDSLRLFEPHPVSVRCRCSHARTSSLLLGMGQEEVTSILREQGKVEIECDFCGRKYHYNQGDVTQLFAGAAAAPSSTPRH